MMGTDFFVSRRLHQGKKPGMKDDLESLAYSIYYLEYKTLPWSDIKRDEKFTNA